MPIKFLKRETATLNMLEKNMGSLIKSIKNLNLENIKLKEKLRELTERMARMENEI